MEAAIKILVRARLYLGPGIKYSMSAERIFRTGAAHKVLLNLAGATVDALNIAHGGNKGAPCLTVICHGLVV